jgi:FAD/FMN-containing dehydrogenase
MPNQGGIIMDFHRVKRIRKIDPFNRCVTAEPGVTYGELISEVKKHVYLSSGTCISQYGFMRLIPGSPGPRWKSFT